MVVLLIKIECTDKIDGQIYEVIFSDYDVANNEARDDNNVYCKRNNHTCLYI